VFSEHAETQEAIGGLAADDLTTRVSLIDDGVRLPRATEPISWPGKPSFLRSGQSNISCRFTRPTFRLIGVGRALGLPLNFNTLVKDGPRRFVNAASPRAPGTPRAPRFMQAASRQGPSQRDWLPRTTGETPGRERSPKPLDDHPECQGFRHRAHPATF
jgi:hypothetical protein